MVTTSTTETTVSSADALQELLVMHGYVAKPEIVKVLYLALRLQKPLLLEGPPGAGKTQIAKVLSEALRMPLIRLQCYEGIDEAKALYEWNEPLQRMALEFIRQSGRQNTWAELKGHLYSPDFLIAGPILRALQSDARTVLLIDEIDKTGPAFEAFLLEILSDFQVSVPQLGTVAAHHRPVVVLTSNAQRKLTDALRGRCFLLWMDYPSTELEAEVITRSRESELRLSSQVARFTAAVRHLGMTKPPAIRESLDWIDALRLLGANELTADVVTQTLPVLLKVEVQARVTNDQEQDRETASYAYELLERLASQAAKNTAPSENIARQFDSPSAATTMPIKPRRVTTTSKTSPVPAVITKIDRMKTRQGESLFLKVDLGGETVRVFGRPEELAERLEASGYDIPASEIEAGMELHLPCLVKLGQGNSGYKIIEEFLPEAAA